MTIKSLSTSSLIDDMEQGKSILSTFGKRGRLLKRRTAMTGFASRLLLFVIFNPIVLYRAKRNPNIWQQLRVAAIRFVRFIFPFQAKGHPMPLSKQAQIFVINHPTLNDPICALLYALDLYPNREIIIPVNLPWFESLCRYRQKLLKIGINVVPVLTPETAKRLGSENQVSKIQSKLISNYIAELTNVLASGGLAIVAQQATRQRYIFSDPAQSESGDGILSTVSFILAGIRRAKLLEKTSFIPLALIPHSVNTKSKLNLFRKYTLNFGVPIMASELGDIKNASKRPADLFVLQKLAELLPYEYRFATK